MPNPILGGGGFHHVCMKTRDWDATLRFYKDTLGCTEKIAWREAPQRAVMLDAGDGNYIEVFAAPPCPAATPTKVPHRAPGRPHRLTAQTRVRRIIAKTVSTTGIVHNP